MPNIDAGAGIYMDVREDCVVIKTASSDPISYSKSKDELLYRVVFEKDGNVFRFSENNKHIKNYFKLFSYGLIKFKNTSKKSFIEKIVDIEILN